MCGTFSGLTDGWRRVDSFARLHIENPRALTQDDVVAIGAVAAVLLNGAFSVEELGDDTILRALVTIGTLVRAMRCTSQEHRPND